MASIQLKHFMIRAMGDGAAEEELNRFLRGHQVLEVRQEFVAEGPNSTWCIAVRYAETDGTQAEAAGGRRDAVDYKEVLDPAAFERFAELRRRRKAIAEAEGLPVFAVFTNEELAGIARLEKPGLADLKTVRGVGAKKVERFGPRILGMETGKENHAASGIPV